MLNGEYSLVHFDDNDCQYISPAKRTTEAFEAVHRSYLGHMISKGRRHHGLPFLIGQSSCFPHNTFLFVKSDLLTLKLVLEMRKCWRGYARISFTKVHQESTYAQISEELISRVPDHF